MSIIQVLVPADIGGGHITMKCERTTTAVTLKRQVIDKVNIRRGTTAGFELDEKDFQLVKLPLGSTLAKYSTDEDKWPDSASSIPDEAKVIETCTTEQERSRTKTRALDMAVGRMRVDPS